MAELTASHLRSSFIKKVHQEVHYQMVFAKGDNGSENNCLVRYQELRQRKIEIPTLELACGVEDSLCKQQENSFQAYKKWIQQHRFHFVSNQNFTISVYGNRT